jgi:hypothetical protein
MVLRCILTKLMPELSSRMVIRLEHLMELTVIYFGLKNMTIKTGINCVNITTNILLILHMAGIWSATAIGRPGVMALNMGRFLVMMVIVPCPSLETGSD